jgi:hypothetical protein
MAYVLVLLLAVAAGAAVGVATYRTGMQPRSNAAAWSRPYEEDAPRSQPAARPAEPAARTPLPDDPTTHTRVVGVLGLLAVCVLAAGAIVGALFAAYLAVRGMFGR